MSGQLTGLAGGRRGTPRLPPAGRVDRVDRWDRLDRGTVTAETAVVLPLLVALTVALVWVVSLAAAQVRVVDAARETARAAARGETPARATELGRRVAPASAEVSLSEAGGVVTVDVVAAVDGPGGLLRILPAVHVSSHAVAAKEVP